MRKLSTFFAGTADLLYSIDSDVETRTQELTNNRELGQKENFVYKRRFFDIFRFADQDKITCGLG